MADPVGLGLFVLSGFWWYALVVSRHPELFSYFIKDEIIGRNLTGRFHRHPEWHAPFTLSLRAADLRAGGPGHRARLPSWTGSCSWSCRLREVLPVVRRQGPCRPRGKLP
ncbi:MAG: hypothetical protein ACE5EO_04885 [Candidatus Krumholzibacteriia bacterium]